MLKMEAATSPEMKVSYIINRHHNPQDHDLNVSIVTKYFSEPHLIISVPLANTFLFESGCRA
jgi:hypothetical protein